MSDMAAKLTNNTMKQWKINSRLQLDKLKKK